MKPIDKKVGLFRHGLWVGIAMLLGGASSTSAGQVESPRPPQEPVVTPEFFFAAQLPPDRITESLPLKVTFTTPMECFADQPVKFLIHVLNTDTQPTRVGMELVVNYGTLGNAAVIDQFPGFGFEGPGSRFIQTRFQTGNTPTNPVRQVKLTLPSLAANESRTFAVTLTPRRIGEFRLTINTASHVVGTTSVMAKFDPNLSVDKLLPMITSTLTPRLPNSLADVPEVGLENPLSKNMKAEEAFEHIAHMIDKVNFANAKKIDAYAAALLEKRADIKGMPMAMGDSCRLKPERASNFRLHLTSLRRAMAETPDGIGLGAMLENPAMNPTPSPSPAVPPSVPGAPPVGDTFDFEKFQSARVAAMMQVLGPESVQMRLEMVKHIATIPGTESTQALANLAVFSEQEPVRSAALEGLKTRPETDYNDILVRGLNYPWPAVAQSASEAIVKLKRNDLIPQLVETLERPDPRAPETRGDKQVVREVVKINHLRNCMLCHPPANGDQKQAETTAELLRFSSTLARFNQDLVAPVPIPNQPLAPPSSDSSPYGRFAGPEVAAIRFDVTYLRQDFSVMLPVADEQPWPQTQRFDFLVRAREITEQDAQAYRDLLRPADGKLSPYQAAALSALRALTGRDAEPTAPAWRRLLEQLRLEAGNG